MSSKSKSMFKDFGTSGEYVVYYSPMLAYNTPFIKVFNDFNSAHSFAVAVAKKYPNENFFVHGFFSNRTYRYFFDISTNSVNMTVIQPCFITI